MIPYVKFIGKDMELQRSTKPFYMMPISLRTNKRANCNAAQHSACEWYGAQNYCTLFLN